MNTIIFTTKKDLELIDITDKIEKAVEESGIKEGMALIYPLHATAAITICESADPNMLIDLENKIKEIFPKNAGYLHDKIASLSILITHTSVFSVAPPITGTGNAVIIYSKLIHRGYSGFTQE